MPEYIEREALRKSLLIGAAYLDEDTMMTVVNVLDCFPAADVTPVRHGRWEVKVGMNFFKERNCPVCKKRIESNFWNYCPNCGTRMDGGETDA